VPQILGLPQEEVPMDVRPVAVAVVAASLAVAAPAAAQDPLEVRGVRAENAPSGGVTITFTSRAARLHRRIAGLRTFVRCQAVIPDGALLARLDRTDELFSQRRLPLTRRPLRVRHAAGARFDVCELTAVRGLRTVRTLTLPLTPEGGAYLAAKRVGNQLVAALEVVSALGPDGHYPAAQDVVVPGLVVLAAPTASPPPRRVGIYSDAAQHMTVVALTPDGRRLFIDADGGVLTSNVPELVLARR
jgi:hypothetical protein